MEMLWMSTGETCIPTANHIKLHWTRKEILVEDMNTNEILLRVLLREPSDDESTRAFKVPTYQDRVGPSWADLLTLKRESGMDAVEETVRKHFPKGADMLVKMLLEDEE